VFLDFKLSIDVDIGAFFGLLFSQNWAKFYSIFWSHFDLILKRLFRKQVPLTQFQAFTKESLLKGKVKYSRPPCTNLFRSASFDIANIIYFFY